MRDKMKQQRREDGNTMCETSRCVLGGRDSIDEMPSEEKEYEEGRTALKKCIWKRLTLEKLSKNPVNSIMLDDMAMYTR